MPVNVDSELLQMALAGYEAELQNIQAKIDDINVRLGGQKGRAGGPPADLRATPVSRAQGAKRHMSAAAKRRIAAAQKKRWAEYRKKHKAA